MEFVFKWYARALRLDIMFLKYERKVTFKYIIHVYANQKLLKMGARIDIEIKYGACFYNTSESNRMKYLK